MHRSSRLLLDAYLCATCTPLVCDMAVPHRFTRKQDCSNSVSYGSLVILQCDQSSELSCFSSVGSSADADESAWDRVCREFLLARES